MNDFLKDLSFLQELNSHHIKDYYISTMVLDFETERPITKLEGYIVSGTLNYVTNSANRKTGSFQIIFDEVISKITDISNLLSPNKKISLSIGVKNPFYQGEYSKYGDIIWFKQGIFIITSASASIATQSRSISIQIADKMSLLNGTCGGTLPATTSLHDRIVIDPQGNSTTTYPRIKQIIYEAVHHFGGEHPSKIIISDIPDFGRQVATWGGSTPVWFAKNSGAFVVSKTPPGDDFPQQKILGDDVGYMSTPLTFPGELIMKAGSTVTGILDEIVKTLGNYEYFYDADGVFIFQQKKNFDKTGNVPVNQEVTSPFNISADATINTQFQSQYLPKYREDQFLNELSSTMNITQASINPKYSNIKNDFVVWGSRTGEDDKDYLVRYHLAIDTKPKEDINLSLCRYNIWCVRNAATKEVNRYYAKKDNVGEIEIPSLGEVGDLIVGNVNYRGEYQETETYYFKGISDSVLYEGEYYSLYLNEQTKKGIKDILPTDEQIWHKMTDTDEELLLHSPSLTRLPIGAPGFDWREELYRQALMAYNSSSEATYYDKELIAEWRLIFNPNTKSRDPLGTLDGFLNPYWGDFEEKWIEHFAGSINSPWNGYTVDIIRSPQTIRYWLDIIDSNSTLGKYSVSKIGRRTIVTDNTKINEVLVREVPDIVFIDGTETDEEIQKARDEYISIGQKYCIVKSDFLPYFSLRNSFGTCYEEIRNLFYTHLIQNISVTISALPLFYLDVNKVIYLNLPDIGITGGYIITSINYNIGTSTTMSIQLTESLTIV